MNALRRRVSTLMRTAVAVLTLAVLIASSAAAGDGTVAIVSTVAGVPGSAGFDDGPAFAARFNRPTWIDIARYDQYGSSPKAGDIFVVDRLNQAIRLITANGVSTYRVTGPRPIDGQWVDGPVTWNFGGAIWRRARCRAGELRLWRRAI
jgi:hypothetical protein